MNACRELGKRGTGNKEQARTTTSGRKTLPIRRYMAAIHLEILLLAYCNISPIDVDRAFARQDGGRGYLCGLAMMA